MFGTLFFRDNIFSGLIFVMKFGKITYIMMPYAHVKFGYDRMMIVDFLHLGVHLVIQLSWLHS